MADRSELESLTKKELSQKARDLGIKVGAKDNKAALVKKILEAPGEDEPARDHDASSLNGELQRIEEKLDGLESSLANLEGSIETLKDGQASITKYVSTIMKAIRMTLLAGGKPVEETGIEAFSTWLKKTLVVFELEGQYGQLIPIHLVRAKVSPGMASSFNSYLFQLEKAGKIGMQTHNSPHELPADERLASIEVPSRGVVYYIMRQTL